MSTEKHWDKIYATRPTPDLGWYEPEPSTLGLVTAHTIPSDSVVDVGGGDSRLVDRLLDLGYGDLTVLDLSAVAIERARGRIGSRASAVDWIHADVTEFVPDRTWHIWHDRAVFHFLVTKAQRDAYRAAALRSITPEGLLVVATFSSEAPEECAGLPISRYDLDSLPEAFAPEFDLVSVSAIAPGLSAEGDRRPYVGAVLRRVAA